MNKNITILILAGVLFLFIFLPDRCSKPEPPAIKTETKEVIKIVKADSVQIKKTIDSLKKIGQILSKEIKETKNDLKTAEALVVELLNDASVIIDSSGKEELHYQLSILKAANAAKDSLCNSTIAAQDSVISNQLNQLAAQEELNSKIRQSFNQVVANDQAKEKYIKQLKKQVKQKKFGNVVWKIAAGAAGVVILKNAL